MQLEFFEIITCYGVTSSHPHTGIYLLFQAVTGPQLPFYDLIARHPGSWHDSRIFDKSRARVLYETKRVPGLLLGDAGYACVPYLMTPLADPGAPGSPEARYATLL
ncbi:hypothetical protein HPB48_013617 [Haemaphysalis longicornis]|uniref:DDE Tnp4 domain-containing protein n=1 Tax=Haemaphysalis longicornis TaxID=44386 RepID=A0A9J6FZ15_HAELO|nr:hypothetical protein HPB48_013617 [Haemaphysalis longicornis]